jgi:hypothetical protein
MASSGSESIHLWSLLDTDSHGNLEVRQATFEAASESLTQA